MSDIKKIINDAWEIKDKINQNSDESKKKGIKKDIEDIDKKKTKITK